MKRKLRFQLVFGAVAFLQLLAEHQQFIRLKMMTKPLLILLLMLALYSTTKLGGRFHKRIFTGLLFAMAGDIILLQPDNSLFSVGLVAFLICQLCYISAFYLDFRSAPELDKQGARIAILVCGAICTGFYFYLRPYLGNLRVPALAYCLVTALTVMMATFRNQRVNRESFRLILAGAICFALSDAFLAINKFTGTFSGAGIWITGTYIAAQYLITMGAIRRKLLNRH